MKNNNKVGAIETVTEILAEVVKPEAFKNNCAIEISISCRKLANKDVLSKSDPQCVVYHRPITAPSWQQLIRTEVIQNNLNPDFATKVTLQYKRDENQFLRFEIHDIDNPGDELNVQDFIGFVECTVAEIIAAGSHGFQHPLDCPENATRATENGFIILNVEELSSSMEMVFLEVTGSSIGSCWSSCCLIKSFFTIAKSNESGNYIVVFRSDEVRGSSPHWPSITLSEQSICNLDRDRQLKIEIYQRNFKGEEKFVGSHFTSVTRMTLEKNKGSRILLDDKNGKTSKAAISILCEIFSNSVASS